MTLNIDAVLVELIDIADSKNDTENADLFQTIRAAFRNQQRIIQRQQRRLRAWGEAFGNALTLTVGDGHVVYGSAEAIGRAQQFIIRATANDQEMPCANDSH